MRNTHGLNLRAITGAGTESFNESESGRSGLWRSAIGAEARSEIGSQWGNPTVDS
jgi:hypothetical protein